MSATTRQYTSDDQQSRDMDIGLNKKRAGSDREGVYEGSSGGANINSYNGEEEGGRDPTTTTPERQHQPSHEQKPEMGLDTARATSRSVVDDMDVVEISPDNNNNLDHHHHPVRTTAAAVGSSSCGKTSSTNIKDYYVPSAHAAAVAAEGGGGAEGSTNLVRLGMLCRGRMSSLAVSHAVSAKRAFDLGLSSSTSSLESFEEGGSRAKNGHTRVPVSRGQPMGRGAASQTTPPSLPLKKHRHPLDTLRKRGFGGSCGTTAEGDGEETAAVVAKLGLLLRREREAKARERDGREMAEEQAKVAYASLESESKRCV